MENVARFCENESSQVKGIDFDKSYSQVAHVDSFIINIAIEAMHRLTASTLDVSNANVPIHERVFAIPPPYHIDWFERY